MMKQLQAFGLAALVAIGSAAQVTAQVEVSGSVDFSYGYYLNKVDAQGMRTFDMAHNSFSLGLAEIVFEKAPSASSRVGGRVDLDFGTTADIVGSFEPGDNETYKHLQQAYISVMANDQVTIDVGKFVTPHGAEVIESQNNWNYTRSVLFGYAIPFYHAGVRVAVAASEQLTLTGYVVNGSNNTTETNSDKTFIAAAAFTPSEQLTWFGNFMAGKEADFDTDGEQDLVWLFDTTLSFVATDVLSLMANFDYGSAANADPATVGDPATFWGVAAYARYQAQEDWALAGRFEYIDDSNDGWLFIGEKAQTFTLTSDHNILDGLITRLELRVDKTESDQFTKDNGDPTNMQPSLTLGMVYVLD